MSHSHPTILAVVLIVIGLIGVWKALQDRKQSKTLSCPGKALNVRDNQYLFMSVVAVLGGGALLAIEHGDSEGSSSVNFY